MGDPKGTATRSLQAHSEGDSGAAERLLPLVYDRLRDLARRFLKGDWRVARAWLLRELDRAGGKT